MRKFFTTTLFVAGLLSLGVTEAGQKLKMKTFHHSDFSVSVPIDWEETRDSNDETVVLTSQNGKDRLTISVMYFKAGVKNDDIRKSFGNYLEARRKAEISETNGKITLTEAIVNDGGDYLFTKYGGYEKAIDRRFIALITAEKLKLFTFYVESTGTNDSHVNDLAAKTFDSIEVK